MSEDVKAVHVWARGTPAAGQKFDGDPNDLRSLKDAGLVLSYHGTSIELHALANNCNLQRKGPNAAFDAALSATLREASQDVEPLVVVDESEGDAE